MQKCTQCLRWFKQALQYRKKNIGLLDGGDQLCQSEGTLAKLIAVLFNLPSLCILKYRLMRKKIYGLIVLGMLLFNSVSVFGQANVYHPFPDSGALWRMRWTEICFIPPPPYYTCNSDYQYILRGDTLINGINYAKLYKEDCQYHLY